MTFTKGGILDSNQLESISGKKWKKGGILSATQLNKLSDGSETKKELVITFTSDGNATVSSNYADIVDEDINNISIKIIESGKETQCVLYKKYYDSEYNETSFHFVSPSSEYQFRLIIPYYPQNMQLTIFKPTYNGTPNLTIES